MGQDSDVLVTGAGGQVGRALALLLPDARSATHADLDVTAAKDVTAAMRGIKLVFHLAAMTAVDECERNPDACWRINALGTANVVAAARATDARVIYVSTDYVFDGTQNRPYEEDDPPHPINQYGLAKLEGETYVGHDPNNLTVRTSWVYGDGHNFVSTILKVARAEKPLVVVDDQRGRPTSALLLARSLVQLAAMEHTGCVHVTGGGPETTWADLAEYSLRVAGLRPAISRTTTAEYVRSKPRLLAPRPMYSVLSLERARQLDLPMPDWRDSIATYVGELM